MFLSQQGLFCASLLAVLPISSQGLGDGGIGISGKGFPEVFSWGMFSCRTLLLLSAKLCGQYLPSFHNHLSWKVLALFLSGDVSPLWGIPSSSCCLCKTPANKGLISCLNS